MTKFKAFLDEWHSHLRCFWETWGILNVQDGFNDSGQAYERQLWFKIDSKIGLRMKEPEFEVFKY